MPGSPHIVPAGCLCRAAGMPALSPVEVLFPLIRAVDRAYRTLVSSGPGPLLEAYRRDSLVIGRRVRIRADHPGAPDQVLAEGVVEGVNDDLSLRLRGDPRPIRDGRLALVDPYGPGVGL